MSHLLNSAVLCQAQKAPVAAWNISMGLQVSPILETQRQERFTKMRGLSFGIPKQDSFLSSKVTSSVKAIRGVVERDSTFDSRVVRLYDRDTGVLLESKETDLNGTFEFKSYGDEKQFYIVSLDDHPSYNGAIMDKVVPKF